MSHIIYNCTRVADYLLFSDMHTKEIYNKYYKY